jgi:hypothetical protein
MSDGAGSFLGVRCALGEGQGVQEGMVLRRG